MGLERASLLIDDNDRALKEIKDRKRTVAIIPISEGSVLHILLTYMFLYFILCFKDEKARETNESMRILALNLTQSLRASGIPSIVIDCEDLGIL